MNEPRERVREENHMTLDRRRLIAGAAAATLAAPAARAQAPTPMKLTLNFLAGGPSAGFVYGRKLGLYRRAGVDLTIEEGRGSATTAQMVATGQTDVGYADAPAAMQVRSRGAPVTVIAPILQTNAFAIMSLEDSNIRRVQDLAGKRVGVQPGTAQTTLLDAIIAASGLDKGRIQFVNIDPAAFVATLLERRVDAILGGADFQAIQIRERGHRINEILYRDVGVPTVGLSVIARDDRLRANADLYRRFVAASLQGWDEARKDPQAAAQAVHEAYPATPAAQYLAQLQVNVRFLCAPGAASLGRVPDANWAETFRLMTEHLGLPRERPIGEYFANDYLPASAPACG
jgi:NitT/TauT family transport system substrate-binding protein